jgi:7-cyano-7-deazaguanine synthase
MAGRAVVLLSGGLDSTTAAAIARRDGWTLFALTVRYGQRHACELEAARRVAAALGVAKHVELDVDLAAFGGSSLVGDGDIPTDRGPGTVDPPGRTARVARRVGGAGREPSTVDGGIPSTYVPARNTILLALALGWAEAIEAERIVIGVNALDYSGYPDCRPEYIAAFDYLASLATRAGVEGRPIRVWAPLQQLTKAAIIRAGQELGVDYALTHSCYDPDPEGRPCGRCDSCRLRARGFADAGVPDPLVPERG